MSLLSFVVGFIVFVHICHAATLPENLQPCKFDDNDCIEQWFNTASPLIIAGIPSMNVPSSDPLHQDLIQGTVLHLNYNYTDTTLEGMMRCRYQDLRLDLEAYTMDVQIICPRFILTGDFSVVGHVLLFPVEGRGKFASITGTYRATNRLSFKRIEGTDGKGHLMIENFNTQPIVDDLVHFEVQSATHPELNEVIYAYTRKNSIELMRLLQGPIWESSFRSLIANTNKFLEAVSIDDLFIF